MPTARSSPAIHSASGRSSPVGDGDVDERRAQLGHPVAVDRGEGRARTGSLTLGLVRRAGGDGRRGGEPIHVPVVRGQHGGRARRRQATTPTTDAGDQRQHG